MPIYIVGTPIGHLSDMTERAKEILSSVDYILCEDTRRTQALLTSLEISHVTLRRFDAHAGENELSGWMQAGLAGKSIALVSDAGMPAVNDPGANLVARARVNGIEVVPIPGVSAVTTLFSVAGFHGAQHFQFRGFYPREKKERAQEMTYLEGHSRGEAFIYFESPHRIVSCLQSFSACARELTFCIGKEMTKLHEKFFTGNLSEVIDLIESEITREGSLGEWCFGVQLVNDSSIKDEEKIGMSDLLCILRDLNVSQSEAVKTVAKRTGVNRNSVYAMALEIFEKK